MSVLLDDLRAAGEVVHDPAILQSYRHDHAAPGLVAAGTPVALVRPRTTAQVQAAVRVAARHGVPLVPRGAGSGLSGGANAVDGGIVLSLERMAGILDLAEDRLTATVQPGVVNATLKTAAASAGLFYAPDPASFEFSTLGGNVATNAGGLCCVKYGVTRDAVLALEVVLANGEVVRMGRQTRKGVTGYDLVGLLCGSEGTLGIITEATLRLLPRPAPAQTLVASFPRLEAAGDAIVRICRRHRPSMLELMDRATIEAVETMQPMDLDADAEALLFAQSDVGTVEGTAEIAAMERICEEAGASLTVTSDDEAEGRLLIAARRLAYTALESTGATVLDDVAVPVPAIPALLRGIQQISSEHELRIGTFGHAGDGNLHPTIVYDAADADQVKHASVAFDAILALAGTLGGTVTGEHGVGLLKRDAAHAELRETIELQRAIKRVFDRADLLNPGKVW
jgi:glycolate oxidase